MCLKYEAFLKQEKNVHVYFRTLNQCLHELNMFKYTLVPRKLVSAHSLEKGEVVAFKISSLGVEAKTSKSRAATDSHCKLPRSL